MPLKAVDEVTRDEEVQVGDFVSLAGQTMILAGKMDEWGADGGIAISGNDEEDENEDEGMDGLRCTL